VLLNYIRGDDNSLYRSRTVTFVDPSYPSGTATATTTTTGVWKLGDIINSTPQVQSSVALNAYQNAYSDTTYADFIKTTAYKSRNVVYTGSNDGMFHAFKLGTVSSLNNAATPFVIAEMVNTDTRTPKPNIGSEEWAFIPRDALPYLQNQAGTNYCHQNLVDGAPAVVDASINKYTNCKMPDGITAAADYWDCERKLDSWKTVVVSSMGLGGASRDAGSNCNETYNPDAVASNNTDCVKSPVTGVGMSSYFALDVTDPTTPIYMWEFSDNSIANDSTITAAVKAADKGLGFTTPGAAIIRVNAVDTDGRAQRAKNGRWFAVLASGPTGAINSGNQTFSGHSDQNLKIYIVDLNGGSTFRKCTSAGATNCNYWVKDTTIPFAFANSLNGAAIDLDRWSSLKDGNYSDDVVYITYTKASLTAGFPTSSTAWDKGGIIRLVTNHNPDPFTWFMSSLIEDIGPITTSIGRMQDRANKKLWVYFGEGRYFFPGDEMTTSRRFFGVTDPCYNQYSDSTSIYSQYTGDGYSNYALGTTASSCPAVSVSDLQNQTTSVTVDSATKQLAASKKGWLIEMAAASGSIGAERVVSDVSATFNGTIFYTTFIPNLTDVCQPGGSTSMWAVKYDTGGTPSAEALIGKAPVQTSSGGVKLIDLGTSFTASGSLGRKLSSALSPMGMAPKGKFPPLLSPKAIKQILNIQEQ
jgi:type IV pilus assembly protein PilY1